MFCSKCNTLNTADSKFCSKCGTKLIEGQDNSGNSAYDSTNSNTQGSTSNNYYYRPIDNPSHFAGFVSCCFPMVGLILYFLWKDEKPNSSKLICKWMIAGVVAYVVLYIVFLLIGFSGASSIMSDPYHYY